MSDFVGIGFTKKYWALVGFFIHDENATIQPPQLTIVQEDSIQEFEDLISHIKKTFKHDDEKTEVKILFSYKDTKYNSFDLNFVPYNKEEEDE